MTTLQAPGPRPDVDGIDAFVQSAAWMEKPSDYAMVLKLTDWLVACSCYIRQLEAALAAELTRADQAERRGIERAMATLLEKSAWLRQYGHADSAPPIDRCAGWIAALLTPEAPHE